MRRGFCALITTGSLLLGPHIAFSAPVLYGVDYPTNTLFTINVNDASVTVVGALSAVTGPTGIAFNRLNKSMYLKDLMGLYALDPSDGSVSLIGGAATSLGLTFNASFTSLYSIAFPNARDLVRIDPTKGATVNLGSSGLSSLGTIEDLATSSSGQVFGAEDSGALITYDLTTGAGSVQFNDVSGGLGLSAIAFDDNDVLYAISVLSDKLLRIDVSTGTSTVIGSIPFVNVSGLAFAEGPFAFPPPPSGAVPEPTSLLLAALGLCLLWALRYLSNRPASAK
jgi:hypothetical protein